MVNPFQIASIPSIIFGVGKRKELPQVIERFGNNVLIITGAGSFRKSAIGSQMLEEITKKNLSCYFESITGEPTPEDIDSIVNKYPDVPIDVIVAIGGGSVVDAGKAISAMAGKRETIVEYLESVGSRQPDGTKLPFIAVPTTAGTGSETTKNAVITRLGENGFKKSLRHDNYVPNVALVDPELTKSCSRELTAATGFDAFTQLLEAYVSPKSSPIIDVLALEGLHNAIHHLKQAWQEGSNLESRTGMAYAAMLSGIALANAGLGTVHGFASSIGGLFPIPHGVVCGTLMAEVAAKNIEKLFHSPNEAFRKYAKVGKLMTSDKSRTDEYYCHFLIDTLRTWTEEMNIPKLSSYGVKIEDIQTIVSITENKNNPVPLSVEEMSAVLTSRI